jgi:diguanylate cyclase (GGDEF)-like protein/PAS domain S-box-containing protein
MSFEGPFDSGHEVDRRAPVWGRRSLDRFLTDLIDAIPDGIYVTNERREIVYWSEGAERITGYSAADIVGSHCYDDILVHEDLYGHKLCTDSCPLEKSIGDGQPRAVNEVFLKREDGERLPVYVKTRRFEIEGCVYGVEVFGELESVAGREVARLVQELSDTAVTDPLTGLFNRRYVDIYLEQQFSLYKRLGQRFGVTHIDLDEFKAINDSFGHATGDDALRFVATILSDGTRKMDLLARYGGDEFIVVSGVSAEDGLEHLGERALHSIRSSRFMTPSEEALTLTVSVGSTLVRPEDESAATTMERADLAMYEIKHAGGDGFRLKL